MHKILLLGAGKIGRMIASFLSGTQEYDVLVGDVDAEALQRIRAQSGVETVELDASDASALGSAMRGRKAVVSALTYLSNPLVARTALEHGASYFDLTEDVETTHCVKQIAGEARQGQIFVPQCGLAPGFVSIVAQHLTKYFDSLETVYMRVGALPQFPTNALTYNLTWSTDGLINEYCNACEAIHDGRRVHLLPLEGVEHFSLEGVRYEAFNTSGGLGTLCDSLDGRVRELNYKTIRYPGHRDLMHLLVDELRLSQRRHVLKDILEHAIPITFQDVVVVFCTVSGRRRGQLVQMSDARKLYGHTIDGEAWSAIQITTASGVCAVLDMFCQGKLTGSGLIRQEQIELEDFLNNRFGHYYRGSKLFNRFTNPSDITGVGHEEPTH
jgi:saccharopine dehydrogenase-like NADP-dependent oxidoreductase